MPAFATPIEQLAYAARAQQFLDRCRFPAAKEDILAWFQRRNTPMELVEDALRLPEREYTSAQDVAAEIVAIRQGCEPHTWTSRVMTE